MGAEVRFATLAAPTSAGKQWICAFREADAARCDKCEAGKCCTRSRRTASAVRLQHAAAAVADRSGVFHGVAGYHDSEYRGADDCGGAPRCTPQHEVSAGKLHAEPCGFYSDQRLDGGQVWNAPGICLGDRATFICWWRAACCRAAADP